MKQSLSDPAGSNGAGSPRSAGPPGREILDFSLPALASADWDTPPAGADPGSTVPERLWFPMDRERTGLGRSPAPVYSAPAAPKGAAAPPPTIPAYGPEHERIEFDVPQVSEDAPSQEMTARRGSLLRVCEPLLRLVCKLNRMKRLGHWNERFEPGPIRAEVEAVFGQIAAAADSSEMAAPLATLAEPLRCFVDVVMTRAGFAFADRWELLSQGNNADMVLLGATAEALRDGGPAAVERLEVLQACLSFTADLLHADPNQPSAESLLDVAGRRLHGAPEDAICPSAYEGVFTSAILPPIGRRIKSLIAVGISVLLLSVSGAVVLNVYYSRSLDQSINAVRAAMERPSQQAAGHRAGGN